MTRGVGLQFGVTACESSKEVVEKGRIIFIAVKPQYVKVVLEEVASQLTPDHVIVSIAAGVPLAVLKVREPEPSSPCRCSPLAVISGTDRHAIHISAACRRTLHFHDACIRYL